MTITHPFHPLRGRRFSLLKIKDHAGQLILMLRGTSRGTFAVPQEWTDRSPPGPEPPQILEWSGLLELLDLLEGLSGRKTDTT